GVPGWRQAPQLGRRRGKSRLDVPPRAGLDRRLVRSLPGVAGAPSAGPHGRRAADGAERERGPRAARAESADRARRGGRRQRLPGDDPQEHQDHEGAATESRGQEIMPTVKVMDAKGHETGTLELKADVFGVDVRGPLLHQAVVRELADRRAGTHDTKGRSEVSGGGRKPWKQKGTGRARQGSIRATQWKGGGKPFGPTPRRYDKAMPREMRREALREAVGAAIADGRLR